MSRLLVLKVVMAGLILVVAMPVSAEEGPRFLKWLDPEDPQDRVIEQYWLAVKNDRATIEQLLDLGTLLFERGFYGDAIEMYERALEVDDERAEAHLRIGLVEHRQGHLNRARRAYRQCLKLSAGHGWCNFYLGMASEELGEVDDALYYFERAFRFAPELADPAVNPQVLYSDLQIAVRTRTYDGRFLERNMPMELLDPERAAATARLEPEEPADAGGSPSAPAGSAGLVPAPAPSGDDETEPAAEPHDENAVKPESGALRSPQPKPEAPPESERSPKGLRQVPSAESQATPTPSPEEGVTIQRVPRASGSSLRRVQPRASTPSPTPTPDEDR